VICPEYLEKGLEKVFNRIHQERMQGMPVLNEKLRVEAVGFCWWQGNCLGILVTPWFINLMLIPEEAETPDGMKVGDKIHHRFPSGTYEFIVGEEEGIGPYQMCSLFSPVFQFEDHEAAVATAEAALEAVMDEENRDTSGFDEKQVERIWRGEEEPGQPDEAVGDEMEKTEKATAGISRRRFITGGLSEKRE